MTDVQTVTGIWAPDSATYLADLKHPLMREEWTAWRLSLGYRPDAAASLRERRDFDRLMVAKYGEICPPPPRTKWLLWGYDIQDMNEDRLAREAAAKRRRETTEEVVTYEEIDL